MRKFKDAKGDQWEINLTVGTVQRVKNASEQRFNLLDHELAAKLWDNELDFWELLWFAIEPQATAKGINAEQFGELMAADCLYDAKRLFYEAWADFFRGLQRDQQATVLEKVLELDGLLKAEWNEKIKSGAFKPLDLKAKTIISSRLNNAFGDALGSLDLMLGSSPGEKSTKPRKGGAT